MAKKRTKQKTDAEALIKLIHPDIGFDESEDDNDSIQKGVDAPDYASLLTAMQQQMSAMESQLATLHRTNVALMAQPVSTTPAPQAKAFSMEGLPDPTLDPQRYAEEVNRRVQDSIRSHQMVAEYQRDQSRQAQSIEEVLWDKFQKTYGAYASDEKKVKYVAEQVLQSVQKQGIDVNKYITGAQDVFMADVVREYDATFGKPVDPDDDDEDDDDTPDNRTGGMFSGVASGGKPEMPNNAEDDMFTTLRQRKIKEGWY